MAIDSENRIFVGGFPNGYYKSIDNGETWTSVPQYARYPFTCSINSQDEIFLSIAAGLGIFRSQDNRMTWIEINSGLTDRTVYCFAYYSDSIVYVGTENGRIYKSTNDGNSWNESDTGVNSTFINCLIIVSNGNIFAGTNNSLFRSTDFGVDWIEINGGFSGQVIKSLAINSSDFVFLGTGTGSVFRSTDFGDSWTELNIGLSQSVSCLTINSNDHIFLTCSNSVFNSTDNGENWRKVNSGLDSTRQYNQIKINQDGYAFVVGGTTIFRSINSTTSVEDKNISALKFLLSQNYPNPFNPSTKISWQTPVSGWQTLKVYDVLGREVATLVNEYRSAGSYEIDFQSTVGSHQLANGVYFYRLQVGDYVETKKMIFLK